MAAQEGPRNGNSVSGMVCDGAESSEIANNAKCAFLAMEVAFFSPTALLEVLRGFLKRALL